MNKVAAIVPAQIEIEQHDIDWLAPQNLQTFRNGAAMAGHMESRLRGEKATGALAK